MDEAPRSRWVTTSWIVLKRTLRISLALGVFAFPAWKILQVRFDPNLLSEAPIEAVWGWHRDLTARFGPWAASRVHEGQAATLPVSDISGTEWPAYRVQMIAVSWPLPDGTLLLPRAVSDVSDAPYIGEAAILANLAQPHAGPQRALQAPVVDGLRTPALVWLLLLGYLGAALALLWPEWRWLLRAFRRRVQALR